MKKRPNIKKTLRSFSALTFTIIYILFIIYLSFFAIQFSIAIDSSSDPNQLSSQPQANSSQLQNSSARSMTQLNSASPYSSSSFVSQRPQTSTINKSNSRANHRTQQRRPLASSNKANELKPTKSQPTSSTNTNQAELDYALLQAKIMAGYSNTPPVFLTPTRDLFVDVGRKPLGSLITTVRANDIEGDSLQYSIRPAIYKDASSYFSINATSGELRLANKQFKYHLPSKISTNESVFSNLSDEDNIYNDGGTLTDDSLEDGSPSSSFSGNQQDDMNLSKNLYFLTISVDDGHLGNNAEFQVHVINSTSIASIHPLPSMAVPLAPANEVSKNMENIMQHKTSEYYNSLYNSTLNRTKPTIVYPDFVNPSISRQAGFSKSSGNSDVSNDELLEDISQVNLSLHEPAVSGTGEQVDKSTGLNVGQNVEQTVSSLSKKVNLAKINQQFSGPQAPLLDSSELSRRIPDETTHLLPQPMVVSLVIICSVLMISLVLLMFIVPLSVKRLRKRLKQVEMHHEHLSKKNSNNSSFICSSSCTGTHQQHHNSSLSQFTLGSDISSCPQRSPICRQSSLDSSLTQHESLQQHQQLFRPNCFYQQQHQRMAQFQPVGKYPHHHPHHQHHHHQSTCNGRQFATNGSIVTNPIFMQQATPVNQLELENHPSFRQQINSGAAIMEARSCSVQSQNKGHFLQSCDSVYQADNNLYCTIQTDTLACPKEITLTKDKQESSSSNNNSRQIIAINNQQSDEANASGSASGSGSRRQSCVVGMIGTNNCQQANNQCQQPPSNFATGLLLANSKLQEASVAMGNQRHEQRHCESPNSVSGSSTKSLARFLSLPARHAAHQQFMASTPNANYEGSTDLADREELFLQTTKTIARASNFQRELKNDNYNWELERHRLKDPFLLGRGEFGLVFRYKLTGGSNSSIPDRTVAVKTLERSSLNDKHGREELLAEINIMKLVCEHPNVVKLLHCCTLDNDAITRPILLVMEYVELGKLQSFLKKCRPNHYYETMTINSNSNNNNCLLFNGLATNNNYSLVTNDDQYVAVNVTGKNDNSIDQHQQQQPQQPQSHHVTPKDLIKFIYHVAKGMEYLSSKCIVHRDLASRNILLSSDRICKIGDFGMARHMQSYSGVYERSSRNTKIPVRWMAPEVLLENTFTTKSDVYSFGILIWEIVTLALTPYPQLKTEQVIEEVARKGQRPEKPEYCHQDLYKIMQQCWSDEPNFRPTFRQLVKQLDELLMSANDYIELDQYPNHHYCNIVAARCSLAERL